MLCCEVKSYLSTAKGLPFFYSVGDTEYNEVLNELRQHGVIVDRMSDFCPKDDKFPDIDEIIDYFWTLDIDCMSNKHVLIGLGEYLSLRGADYTEKQLRRLKNTTLGTARVILLLRGISHQVRSLIAEDERLLAQKRVYIGCSPISEVSVITVKYPLFKNTSSGIKGLIKDFEDGCSGNCYTRTQLDLSKSLIPVSSVCNAYDAIRRVISDFPLEIELGDEKLWNRLFSELNNHSFSLEKMFDHYGFTDDYYDDLYMNCSGLEFKNWFYFIFLKYNEERIKNSYLRYVVHKTTAFEILKENIVSEIIHVSRKDSCFYTYYEERKKLIKFFPESDLATFVHENEIDPNECIYRYTDCTKLECTKIIEWVARNGYIAEIEYIYPALNSYLKPYAFKCGKYSAALTDYFYQYRQQKVTNRIFPAFLETVQENAQKLPYVHLETRDSAILGIKDKKNACLYWIDALGVEYLAYISDLVQNKGLSMHVDISYAELPSITSINKGFYDKWPGPLKLKNESLDNIKHKDVGGYEYTDGSAPTYIYSELQVIKKAIDYAATELSLHHCKSFIIASDHGASRLAVIHKQEEKYETDTKGEHSGRCCKEFPNADLNFALKENGYLVLADYGRFKKSRAANVEVHGGASLEEVVVPVITLTLKKQSIQTITVLNADSIMSDRHVGTRVGLYISDVEHQNNVVLVIGDKSYPVERIDDSHFSVLLYDQKRAKKAISATIFDGEDLIGNIEFDIKGRTATMNDDFEDLL